MGYASLQQVVTSAEDLTLHDGALARTKGLWHLIIFLRATRLQFSRTLTLGSFDLAEAAFDVLGIRLPIEQTSRNVYFEPGASQGNSALAMFRHREGPRQTFLNRIQTGSLSGGLSKPDLFAVNQSVLPITVSLREGWIVNLRSYPDNTRALDNLVQMFFTWLFRYGVPTLDSGTASIARNLGQGEMVKRENVQLSPVPSTRNDFSQLVRDFFRLSSTECSALFPRLNNVDLNAWSSLSTLPMESLQPALLQAFSRTAHQQPTHGEAATVDSQDENASHSSSNETLAATNTGAQDYDADWECILTRVLIRLAQIPLVGIESSAIKTVAALKAGKYVILLGPPGTGKTELAQVICECGVDCGIPGFTVATATSDWSTFETIGGYMPSTENDGELVFSENVFVESVRTGRWLVIDELNRADMDKAFGELFTLFSGNRVRLPYRIDQKSIVLLPPGAATNEELEHPIYLLRDWRMLGTMNTFDKASLFQLSYAFMRRFAFIEVQVPQPALYDQLLSDRVAQELNGENQTVIATETSGYLRRVFASEENWSLSASGMLVGPAIPIDIIHYLKQRFDIDELRHVTSNSKELVLEGLEMYLYPQFEGRNEFHEQILTALVTALDLNAGQRTRTAKVLSDWTGAEDTAPSV